jgi:hypothetical protein
VDAAYAGNALICEEFRELMPGTEVKISSNNSNKNESILFTKKKLAAYLFIVFFFHFSSISTHLASILTNGCLLILIALVCGTLVISQRKKSNKIKYFSIVF